MPKDCLIVIDMLNDYLDRWEASSRSLIISKTNQLVDAFRSGDYPIVWVRQAFKPDLSDAFLEMRDRQISVTIEGTRGAEIHSDLDQRSTDTVITKKRYSAFFGTNLDEVLKALSVERITLAGINTHACIRMAAIDAYQRDMRVTIAVDCVDSNDREHGRMSLNYMSGKIATVLTNEAIVNALN